VDTIRSFSVSKQLPPLVPTPPNTVRHGQQPQPQQQQIHTLGSNVSLASMGSTHSVSSGSFDIGSSDDFLTQDSDLFSVAPTTGESLDRQHEIQEAPTHRTSIPLRNGNGDKVEPTGYNMVNPEARSAQVAGGGLESAH